jgi:hydrogenase expression/formation protein HypC
MCLAVPMRLIEADGARGTVEVEGVRREVRLDLLEAAQPGDWLLIHAGYAIQVLDEAAAAETLELLREIQDSAADEPLAE